MQITFMGPGTLKVPLKVTQNVFLFFNLFHKNNNYKELSLKCKHKLLCMFNYPVSDIFFFVHIR